MKPSIFVPFLITTVLTGVLAVLPLSSVSRRPSSNLLPNTFIVELERVSDLIGKRSPKSAHGAFYSELAKRANDFTIRREFNQQDVFVGASITLPGNQDLAHISQIPGVKGIRPVVLIPRPKVFNKLIPSGPDDPSVPEDSESTHIMTGVDKLHAEGVFGDGIKIGIVDTGTDYTHPALGGGFGEGKKIAGGYDFAGDDYNGTNTPKPDSDPLDQCAGHGTHVAGIVGANPGNEFGVSGVAYKSTLFSYRIFGCNGSSADDMVIEALLRAHSDGMDVVTLSIGGTDGWTEGMTSVVASRIAEQGKIVTIAAGNEGSFGAWMSSSPANGIDVISIGSVDNTVIPVQNATTSDPSHPNIVYFSALPLEINGTFPIYATSKNTTVVDDACKPLPADTPDLSNFLVIVRRGTCKFVDKLKNIADKGAKVSFIYNNQDGYALIDTGKFTASLIPASDGEFLVKRFAAGANITVTFPRGGRPSNLVSPTGGLISNYSTYGPSYDLFMKPAVAAPGGAILSTFPVPLGTWAVLSGTSMAAPFVAGCAALLLEAKGASADVARAARTLFETTAQRVPASRSDGDPLQTVAVQGAGLINAYNAVRYTTRVEPGELLLNDTAHFDGAHTITVYNMGPATEEYTVRHVPAGTAATIQAGKIFAADGPVPLTRDYATVALSRNTLRVEAGDSATVRAEFVAPTGADKTTFPVYSGFIEIVGAGRGERLQVVYQGVAAAMRDMRVLDDTAGFFNGSGEPLPALLDAAGKPQRGAVEYTFEGKDYPTLLFRLVAGTPRLAVDLVAENTTLRRRQLASDWTPFDDDEGEHGGTYAQVPTLGPLGEFDYQPRNTDANNSDSGYNLLPFTPAAFANNTAVPAGRYRLLLRALRITGDARDEDDYEAYLSPVVGVRGQQ